MGNSDMQSRSKEDSWNLLPLTPTYIEEEHGNYVVALTTALDNPSIKNIALSGNFGVGKSSILQEVAEREPGRVVEISLSTLAPMSEASDQSSVPEQATTTTNRIQQEIVKQLLYREEPTRTRGSRFRRIEPFLFRRELALSLVLALVVTAIFTIAGWGGTIATTLAPNTELRFWVYPLLLVLATFVIFILRKNLHGRIHLKGFSAGPASVTLDENSVSYFDQYLDEIVYFFETSKYDVVIFEDIDRFNDSHIFETLRSLNTLLNAAPQIKKRPIRFIYAIRDSIFDRLGLEFEGRKDRSIADIEDPAEAESLRANRTKFFDLVIPVVPFITHRSGRDLAGKVLEDIRHNVDLKLLDLAGRAVPDMRLLKNIRNEFIVFRDRIFSGEGKGLELNETELLAMMLYKSTHLGDFEAIRFGRSKLDTLYSVSRRLVSENISRLQSEQRAAKRAIDNLEIQPDRANQLGDRLIKQIVGTARAAGIKNLLGQYTFQNSIVSIDQVKSVEFWRELVEASDDTSITWKSDYQGKVEFSRSEIADLLDDPLDANHWREVDQERLQHEVEERERQLKFLRGADMGDLINHPEFTVKLEAENSQGIKLEGSQSLASIAESVLKPGLAFKLVRRKYLSRNFTLYTSTFYGDRVSAAATNFIIHHVERDVMDVHFPLEANDIEAVIRECGEDSLREPALFNISILDYLLENDVEKARLMVGIVARLGERAEEFLQQYLTSSKQRHLFIPHFVQMCPEALNFVVETPTFDDATRLELVNDILKNLGQDVEYRLGDATSQYLQDHYGELQALVSDELGEETAERISRVYRTAGSKLPDLTPLTRAIREAFVAFSLFEITRENLKAALGANVSLALDSIRATDIGVYKHVLAHLGDYLRVSEGRDTTNDSDEGFLVTIDDVLAFDPDCVESVIERASPGSRVNSLSDVPVVTWQVLARSNRFPATVSNVSGYISEFGSVDGDLAQVLRISGQIDVVDKASEDEKMSLARKILDSSSTLDPAGRVQLVDSLCLENYLAASIIGAENSELFTLLVQHEIVEDSLDTYEHIEGINWEYREEFIAASSDFKDYMTPELVRGDLDRLLTSQKIGDLVKLQVLEDARAYSDVASDAGLLEIARAALLHNRELPFDVIEKLPDSGADASTVVALLVPYLGVIDDASLVLVLDSLGAPYKDLASLGRDRPKLSNTDSDLSLLEHLKSMKIVSSWTQKDSSLIVNKKHK